MLHCHPRQAWALMKRGRSLKEVASMSHDDPGDLDRAIWDWRAKIVRGLRVPGHMTTDVAFDLIEQHPDRIAAHRAEARA